LVIVQVQIQLKWTGKTEEREKEIYTLRLCQISVVL